MKTRLEVIEFAARRIGVLSTDESLTADQVAAIGGVLDALYDEIDTEAAPTWDLTAVPLDCFSQLGNLLAQEIAPIYGLPAPNSRGGAWLRLMSRIRPDSRDATEVVFY